MINQLRDALRDVAASWQDWYRFVIAPGAIPYKVALDRALDLEEACARIAALTGDDVEMVKDRVKDRAYETVLTASEVAAEMEVDAMMGRHW